MKTPALKSSSGYALTFSAKCEAFLQVVFLPPAATETNASNSIDFEVDGNWTPLNKAELDAAIFNSSSKKAPGLDRMSFTIIKKVYCTIPDTFYVLYSKLIAVGYHPTVWKESIGVIIKKAKKEDYSDPKAYRIISLLNCLGKVFEKIVAESLSYLAETTSLLFLNQMGSRKQRSAIDAALSLLSNIELNQHKKKFTSCLFKDNKGAYDHVDKAQLLDIWSKN
ncbi:hypothetical protein VTO42DRAFT_4681 [Malbranchea cinnamomea]